MTVVKRHWRCDICDLETTTQHDTCPDINTPSIKALPPGWWAWCEHHLCESCAPLGRAYQTKCEEVKKMRHDFAKPHYDLARDAYTHIIQPAEDFARANPLPLPPWK